MSVTDGLVQKAGHTEQPQSSYSLLPHLIFILKKKQTHRYKEQTSGYQWGEGREEGQGKGSGLKGTNLQV